MRKSVRSVALLVVGAFALSACGFLSGLVPDQTIAGGVLGLGDGVEVDLSPSVLTVSAVEASTVTTWVGTLQASVTLDGLAGIDLPNLVSPAAITERIVLGDTVVVRNPAADAGPFTLTGLVLGGTVTVDGLSFPVPASAGVTGLVVPFGDPTCVSDGEERVCTYTTAGSVPGVEVAFLPNQVQAYWNLLRSSGGTVAVDLIVTVALAAPGLPLGATVTVTLVSGGATIEF
jgi:hypothetical protein